MKAFIDGSSNGRYGYLLEDGTKRIVEDYPMTNNEVEWLALLLLLTDLEAETEIEVFSDSQIVVNQFSGEWQTNEENLQYLRGVCKLLAEIKNLDIILTWIPRDKNPMGKELDRIINRERRARAKRREKLERGQENA